MHQLEQTSCGFCGDFLCDNPFIASTETATAECFEASRRRGRRAATDHNTEPVTTASTLNPNTEATPDMTNP